MCILMSPKSHDWFYILMDIFYRPTKNTKQHFEMAPYPGHVQTNIHIGKKTTSFKNGQLRKSFGIL